MRWNASGRSRPTRCSSAQTASRARSTACSGEGGRRGLPCDLRETAPQGLDQELTATREEFVGGTREARLEPGARRSSTSAADTAAREPVITFGDEDGPVDAEPEVVAEVEEEGTSGTSCPRWRSLRSAKDFEEEEAPEVPEEAPAEASRGDWLTIPQRRRARA